MCLLDLQKKEKSKMEVYFTFPHLAMAVVHLSDFVICAGGWGQHYRSEVIKLK